MAVTLSELAGLSKQAGFNLDVAAEHNAVHGVWTTKRFRDADGDNGIGVVIAIAEEGEFLNFVAPEIYDLKGCANRAAAIEAMARIAYVTPYVGYELDPETDAVRATIEFPLESATVTTDQLRCSVGMLVSIVDQFDPVVRHAIATGEIDLARADQKPPAARDELDALIEKLGGIDKLRELAAEQGGAPSES